VDLLVNILGFEQ